MTSNKTWLHFFTALLLATALLFTPLGNATAQMANGIQVEINKGAMMRLPGNASVVAVADPEVADVEVLAPNLISIQGRSVGQTTVIAFNEGGDEILNETITVSHNISNLKKLIRQIMPDSNIRFDSVDGALVMSGSVASPLEADNIRRMVEPFLGEDALVNMLDVQGSDQVMLKVRVAEVSRSELKRFGINLAAVLSQSSDFAFGLVTGRDLGAGGVGAIARGDGNNNIGLGYDSGNLDVNSVIDALAEDNVIKLLAQPNLTTASGRTANFLAGGEFPIPVPGENSQVTIEWRQYGVALQFTPHVLSKDKISLTVAPEVSELSQIGAVNLQGFNVPALTTRRAETTVELGSGQSFAVAGLLQSGSSNDVSKFPGLGDIPVLGALFRSTEFQNDQSELVIIVTPYIVRGVPESELADPTEGYIPPTDPERILEGHTYTPEKPAAGAYQLEGSPSNLRRPKYRRTLADQDAGTFKPTEEMMRPAPPVAKTSEVERTRMQPPARQEAAPAQAAPVQTAPSAPAGQPAASPAARPATLNGPVGYRLR